MAHKGTQSMFEALQEIDAYYDIGRAEKRLKRIFTGLGVDKFIDMFTYRIQSLKPSSVQNLNDQFVAFLQTLSESDISGTTNLGITKEMVQKCRRANIVYGFLRKKEK
jgi:hypothetical protein|tara:strand:- start:142 stop:465 length:324 start_codon:yes stop_codon:yes gene_type:complete